MPHARSTIVAAAVTALGDLSTVDRVKAGRAAPMPVAQAPYLLVYGRSERSQPMTMRGPARRLERELTLAVEIVTALADNDEQADAIALEVERALCADPTLGGVAKDLWLSLTMLEANADGEARTGRARLEFSVTYHTAANAPDQAI